MTRLAYPLALLILLTLMLCACAAPTPTPPPANPPTDTSAPTVAPTVVPTNPPVVVTTAPPTAVPTNPPAPTRVRTNTPAPTPTIAHPNVFTFKTDAPVLAHSKPGVFPMQYIDPGAMVVHDDKIYMFYNGINGWPAPVGFGLATSEDGVTWTRVGDNPILKTDGLPYVGFTSFASSALVQDDGTWVIYFYALEEQNFEKGTIGRATAKSAEGPWTADAAPVLLPGGEGTWDSYQVAQPSVVQTDDGYVMYYTGGAQKNGVRRVGMATSSDGIKWTKYRDPAMTDAMYAESTPVLDVGAKGAWDDTRLFDANVIKNDDGWTMTYGADKFQYKDVAFGVATSEDGIHWTRQYNSLLLTPSEVKDGVAAYISTMVYHDGTYLLYFDVGRGRRGTDIFLASHKGPFSGGAQ